MKNQHFSFILSCLATAFSFSQSFTILDESPKTTDFDYVKFVVYDNDILYTKNSAAIGAGFIPLTRINYGIPNEYADLNIQGSFGFSDHETVSRFQFYLTNQKKIGSKIILQSTFNGIYNGTIFSLNSSRSDVIIEPSFNNNFRLIGVDRAISTRIVEDLSTNNDYIAVTLHTPEETQEFALPSNLTFGSPDGFFLWNDNLYFTAEDGSGGRELFKTDAFQTTRVTKLRIPNNLNSTGPSRFYNRDPNKLFFAGNYRIFNTPPQTGSTNLGRELCYTNGSPNLGNTETHISGNDDGSSGYIAFQTGVPSPTNYSGSGPLILGKSNDNLIYYATNNFMRRFYSHPGNVDLMIDTPRNLSLGDLEYLELNNKVYISYLPENISNGASLFETDGTPEGTLSIPVPTIPSEGAVASPFRIVNMFKHNGKIYYKAFYNLNIPTQYFLEYDPVTQQSVILFEFPEGTGTTLKPYTSGFVFNGKGKLYGWNIESRAAVMSLSITEPAQNVEFKYNNEIFKFGIASVTAIATEDQLKINLLDDTSIPYQFIVDLPATSTNQLSKLFYSLNTYDNSTVFNSNLKLGYNDAMFEGLNTLDPNFLSVKSFSDNQWIDRPIINIDQINKTVTINGDFTNDTYMFFEYNGTLSIDKNKSFEISIYPNPAKKSVTLILPEFKNHTITIVDFLGKIQAIHKSDSTKATIDISQLSAGVYIVNVQNDMGDRSTQKLIVN